jgi:hypothetical protein
MVAETFTNISKRSGSFGWCNLRRSHSLACRLLALRDSLRGAGTCPKLGLDRKSLAENQIAACDPNRISVIQPSVLWTVLVDEAVAKWLRLGHLREHATYEIGIAINATWLQ